MNSNLFVVLFVCLYSGVWSEDTDNKFRPCANNDDKTACCLNYIKDHSDCNDSPAEEPLHRDYVIILLSAINCTLTYPSSTVTGLKSGIIEDCYIDKKTGDFITLGRFDATTIRVDECEFSFHVKGEDDISITVPLNATYQHLTTSISPTSESGKIDLLKTKVRCYVPNDQPSFYIGDDVMYSSIPQVQYAVGTLMNNLGVGLAETCTTECRNFFYGFLFLNGINCNSPQTAYDNKHIIYSI